MLGYRRLVGRLSRQTAARESKIARLIGKLDVRAVHGYGSKFVPEGDTGFVRFQRHTRAIAYVRSHDTGGSACQVGAVIDAEFTQKRRNVKFDRAYGDVESVGDLFVGSVADHGMEDFSLPRTQACGTGNRPPFFQEFLCARGQAFDQCLLRWNEDGKVARFVSSDQALHSQQARHALHGAIRVSARCGAELSYSRGLIAENEGVEWAVLNIRYSLLCMRNRFRKRTQFLHNAPPLSLRNWPERSLFSVTTRVTRNGWVEQRRKKRIVSFLQNSRSERAQVPRNAYQSETGPDGVADAMPNFVTGVSSAFCGQIWGHLSTMIRLIR